MHVNMVASSSSFTNVSKTSYPTCLAFGEQKSLAAYIKNHAYSNAKTEDLWAALEAGSGEPVNKLMSSWTKQKGYPVVSAKIKDGKLELEQVLRLISLSGCSVYTTLGYCA